MRHNSRGADLYKQLGSFITKYAEPMDPQKLRDFIINNNLDVNNGFEGADFLHQSFIRGHVSVFATLLSCGAVVSNQLADNIGDWPHESSKLEKFQRLFLAHQQGESIDIFQEDHNEHLNIGSARLSTESDNSMGTTRLSIASDNSMGM